MHKQGGRSFALSFLWLRAVTIYVHVARSRPALPIASDKEQHQLKGEKTISARWSPCSVARAPAWGAARARGGDLSAQWLKLPPEVLPVHACCDGGGGGASGSNSCLRCCPCSCSRGCQWLGLPPEVLPARVLVVVVAAALASGA